MMIGEPTLMVPNLQISHPHTSLTPLPSPSPSPFPLDTLSLNFNANAAASDYPSSIDSSTPLHPFLSSDFDLLSDDHDLDVPFDAFSGDHFRMFEFKIRKCARARSHDWTECPYAHPAEKARRRDPRKHHYSGAACPDFRKGNCKKGDSCEFAHGVFECWLHPSRYRTQFCKDGTNCRRRVCFFAHNPDQLRFLANPSSDSPDASPIWHASFVSSPTSVLNSSPISTLSDSPPTSPGNPRYSVGEIATSMRNVQLDDKLPSTRGLASSPRAFQMGSVFGSPRGSNLRPGFSSLPSTPTQGVTKSGVSPMEPWDQSHHEEPAMERVESGRELRAKIYAKLSKENSFGRSNTGVSVPPDFRMF